MFKWFKDQVRKKKNRTPDSDNETFTHLTRPPSNQVEEAVEAVSLVSSESTDDISQKEERDRNENQNPESSDCFQIQEAWPRPTAQDYLPSLVRGRQTPSHAFAKFLTLQPQQSPSHNQLKAQTDDNGPCERNPRPEEGSTKPCDETELESTTGSHSIFQSVNNGLGENDSLPNPQEPFALRVERVAVADISSSEELEVNTCISQEDMANTCSSNEGGASTYSASKHYANTFSQQEDMASACIPEESCLYLPSDAPTNFKKDLEAQKPEVYDSSTPDQASSPARVLSDILFIQDSQEDEIAQRNIPNFEGYEELEKQKQALPSQKIGKLLQGDVNICPEGSMSEDKAIPVDYDACGEVEENDHTEEIAQMQNPSNDESSRNLALEDRNLCQCPPQCCLQLACLYNQRGQKCTVLGEQFILTYIKKSPVLVSTKIENSTVSPVGCMFVWRSGQAILIQDLPDGAEIYFDAILAPGTCTFVAVVIWQITKPFHSIEPYYDSYVISKEVKNCPVEFASFSKVHGVVTANIEGDKRSIMFSVSDLYIHGRNAKGKDDIKMLTQDTSKQIHADVLKLATRDAMGNVFYGYVCSCMWIGCKPSQASLPVVYDHLKLYKKTPGCFVVAGRQSLLHCDVDAELVVKKAQYRLHFETGGKITEVLCNKESIFCGSKRALVLSGGKVKAHLRRQQCKGSDIWRVVVVQVPLPLLTGPAEHHGIEYAGENTIELSPLKAHPQNLREHTAEDLIQSSPSKASMQNHSEAPLLAQASPDRFEEDRMTTGKYEIDMKLNMKGSHTKPHTSATDVDLQVKECEEQTLLTGNNDTLAISHSSATSLTREQPRQYVSGSSCQFELDYGNAPEKEQPTPASCVYYESFTKGDKLLNPGSCFTQPQEVYPNLLKNFSGVLQWMADKKVFIISAEVYGKPMVLHVGKSSWVVIDGVVTKVTKSAPKQLVCFDAFFDKSSALYRVVAMWHGEKPKKVVYGGFTYYYDVPGVYLGLDEEHLKLIVLHEGTLVIKAYTTSRIYTPEGECYPSIPVLSPVLLHMREKNDTWLLPLVILQPKHASSISEVKWTCSALCPERYFSLQSDITEDHQVSLQPGNTKDNGCKPLFMQHRIASGELIHYLKNLTGTLTQEAGETVILSFHETTPLLVTVPKDGVVNVDTIMISIEDIPFGTELHFDAFCEDPSSLQYRTVIMWISQRPNMGITTSGLKCYFDVCGQCLTSYGNEVSLELYIEDQVLCVRCESAFVIFSDGKYKGIEALERGEAIHAHLAQCGVNYWVNSFIFTCRVPSLVILPSSVTKGEELEGRSVATNSITSKTNWKQTEMVETSDSTRMETSLTALQSEHDCLAAETAHERQPENTYVEAFVKVHYMFIVLKGKITKSRENLFFTAAEEGINLSLEVHPQDIAMDEPVRDEAPYPFYLVYNTRAERVVCGWHQHKPRKVYLQHFLRIHNYCPENDLLTMSLPEESGLQHFRFDSGCLVRAKTIFSFKDAQCQGLAVHPIIEDIEPCFIAGYKVNKCIVFLTSNIELSLVCLKFLAFSFTFKQSINVEDQSLSSTVSSGSPHSIGNVMLANEEQSVCSESPREGTTPPLRSQIKLNASLKPQHVVAEQKVEASLVEKNLTELTELDHSKRREDKCVPGERCAAQPQKHQLHEENHSGNNYSFLGEPLRESLAKRPLNQVMKYLTLRGEVLCVAHDTLHFYSHTVSSPISLPADIPHISADFSENVESYLLVHKKIIHETGAITYKPVMVWQERRKCNPYIIKTQRISVCGDKLIFIYDADTGIQKCYLYDNDCVWLIRMKYKINEILDLCKQNMNYTLFAVVEDIPSLETQEHYLIKGNVLLLTLSKSLALAAIDTLIGSSCEEELELTSQDLTCKIVQLIYSYKMRQYAALGCERGSTCYLSGKRFVQKHNMKVVGGCLEVYKKDYAYIHFNKRSNITVCHLSNVYYQGKNIASWEDIPRKYWKNFQAVIEPIPSIINEDNREIGAVSLVAWCCQHPELLAIHQCEYHVPTLIVPQHRQDDDEATQIIPPRLGREPSDSTWPPGSSVRAGMFVSLIELESSQCQAGATIFSFHKDVVQSCGLKKIDGKILCVQGNTVIVMSTEMKKVWCDLSDIFIKGNRCQYVEEVMISMEKTFCLIATECPTVVKAGEVVNMKGVLGFVRSDENLPGIHVCKTHKTILENSLSKEEYVIAKQVFHDIEILCQQSDVCYEYLLETLVYPQDSPETLDIMKTENHKLCFGVVVDVDQYQPSQVSVRLQYQDQTLVLPVHRSRLLGLPRGLLLHAIVGLSLKLIVGSVKVNKTLKFRIVIGWGNFLPLSNTSSNYVHDSRACTSGGKTLCCPGALEVNMFQSLYSRRMFELKAVDGLTADELISDNSKITSVMGRPHETKIYGQTCWNILIQKHSETTESKALTGVVAAWGGDISSLSVQICYTHGTSALNITPKEEKEDSARKSSSLPCNSRIRHHSEPQSNVILVRRKLKKLTTLEDGLCQYSSSLPSCQNVESSCEVYGSNGEDKQETQSSVADSTTSSLFDVEEDLTSVKTDEEMVLPDVDAAEGTEENNPVSPFEDLKISCSYTFGSTFTVIESNWFNYFDDHLGFIIDDITNAIVLVRQSKLYVSMVKAQKSIREIVQGKEHEIIFAVIVPLTSPANLLNLEVTHEAVVAWLGPRPVGVGSMLKSSLRFLQPVELPAVDKVSANRILLECDSIPGGLHASDSASTNTEGGSAGVGRLMLPVLHREPQTVTGCVLGHYSSNYGTLLSADNSILFCGSLVLGPQLVEKAPGAVKCALQWKMTTALVLQLRQPLEVFEYIVNSVALLVWVHYKPVINEDSIEKSLNVYRQCLGVEIVKEILTHSEDNTEKLLDRVESPSVSPQENDVERDVGFHINKEVFFNPTQPLICFVCKVLSVEDDILLIQTGDKIALAVRDDIVIELKHVNLPITKAKALSAILAELADPVEVFGQRITHFALLAFDAKKPSYAELIINSWMEGTAEKSVQIRRTVESVLKIVTIKVKASTSPSTNPKPACPEASLSSATPKVKAILPPSRNPKPVCPEALSSFVPTKNKLSQAKCEIYKIMSGTGLMEVKFEKGKAKVFFSRDVVYINKKPLSKEEPLAKQMLSQDKTWMCSARKFPVKKGKAVKKIAGEEVHFFAHLIWCGPIPSAEDMQSKPEEKTVGRPSGVTKPEGPSAPGAPSLGEAEPCGAAYATESGARAAEEQVPVEGLAELSGVESPISAASKKQSRRKKQRFKDAGLDWSDGDDDDDDDDDEEEGAKKGFITEVHQSVAQLCLEDKELEYFSREKCFLYGVCLNKVELWHVLSIGQHVNYELTMDGKELKGVWVGSMFPPDPMLLAHTLQQWCLSNSVTPEATSALLMEVGWLPTELNPTAGQGEEKDVVEAGFWHVES